MRKVGGLGFVLYEDHQSAGGPGFSGDEVDAENGTNAVKCSALAFTKTLLNIDDKYSFLQRCYLAAFAPYRDKSALQKQPDPS